ncbi:MAG: hypothetical protein ABIA78_00750 [archaeon]
MNNKKKLIIFCASMIFAFVFWRLVVFFRQGEISILRGATGLNLHHYHYGILFILIAVLVFIFYKAEKYSVALAGFGMGSFFDGFVSRVSGNTVRATEITRYNEGFLLTSFLFVILMLFAICGYLVFRRKENLLSGK